jgi:OCT family organic cation transporter-like MFS transporter 4/5
MILTQGIILTGFVMACELFPAQYRTFAGMAIENFWATGMCLLALWAYLIRHWRYLQLFISLLGLFAIPLFW